MYQRQVRLKEIWHLSSAQAQKMQDFETINHLAYSIFMHKEQQFYSVLTVFTSHGLTRFKSQKVMVNCTKIIAAAVGWISSVRRYLFVQELLSITSSKVGLFLLLV